MKKHTSYIIESRDDDYNVWIVRQSLSSEEAAIRSLAFLREVEPGCSFRIREEIVTVEERIVILYIPDNEEESE